MEERMTEREYLDALLEEEIGKGNGDAQVFPGITIFGLKEIVDNECTEKER